MEELEKPDWVLSHLSGEIGGKLADMHTKEMQASLFDIREPDDYWGLDDVKAAFTDEEGNSRRDMFNEFYAGMKSKYDQSREIEFDINNFTLPARSDLAAAMNKPAPHSRVYKGTPDPWGRSFGYDGTGYSEKRRGVRETGIKNGVKAGDKYIPVSEYTGMVKFAKNSDGSFAFDEKGLPYLVPIKENEELRTFDEVYNKTSETLGFYGYETTWKTLLASLPKNAINFLVNTVDSVAEYGKILFDENSETYKDSVNLENYFKSMKIASTEEGQDFFSTENILDLSQQVIYQLGALVATRGLGALAGLPRLGSVGGKLLLTAMAAGGTAEVARENNLSRGEIASILAVSSMGMYWAQGLSEAAIGMANMKYSAPAFTEAFKKHGAALVEGGISGPKLKAFSRAIGTEYNKLAFKAVNNYGLPGVVAGATFESAEEVAEQLVDVGVRNLFNLYTDASGGDDSKKFQMDWAHELELIGYSAVGGAIGGAIANRLFKRLGMVQPDIHLSFIDEVSQGNEGKLYSLIDKLEQQERFAPAWKDKDGNFVTPEKSQNATVAAGMRGIIDYLVKFREDRGINRMFNNNKKAVKAAMRTALGEDSGKILEFSEMGPEVSKLIADITGLQADVSETEAVDRQTQIGGELDAKVERLNQIVRGEHAEKYLAQGIFNFDRLSREHFSSLKGRDFTDLITNAETTVASKNASREELIKLAEENAEKVKGGEKAAVDERVKIEQIQELEKEKDEYINRIVENKDAITPNLNEPTTISFLKYDRNKEIHDNAVYTLEDEISNIPEEFRADAQKVIDLHRKIKETSELDTITIPEEATFIGEFMKMVDVAEDGSIRSQDINIKDKLKEEESIKADMEKTGVYTNTESLTRIANSITARMDALMVLPNAKEPVNNIRATVNKQPLEFNDTDVLDAIRQLSDMHGIVNKLLELSLYNENSPEAALQRATLSRVKEESDMLYNIANYTSSSGLNEVKDIVDKYSTSLEQALSSNIPETIRIMSQIEHEIYNKFYRNKDAILSRIRPDKNGLNSDDVNSGNYDELINTYNYARAILSLDSVKFFKTYRELVSDVSEELPQASHEQMLTIKRAVQSLAADKYNPGFFITFGGDINHNFTTAVQGKGGTGKTSVIMPLIVGVYNKIYGGDVAVSSYDDGRGYKIQNVVNSIDSYLKGQDIKIRSYKDLIKILKDRDGVEDINLLVYDEATLLTSRQLGRIQKEVLDINRKRYKNGKKNYMKILYSYDANQNAIDFNPDSKDTSIDGVLDVRKHRMDRVPPVRFSFRQTNQPLRSASTIFEAIQKTKGLNKEKYIFEYDDDSGVEIKHDQSKFDSKVIKQLNKLKASNDIDKAVYITNKGDNTEINPEIIATNVLILTPEKAQSEEWDYAFYDPKDGKVFKEDAYNLVPKKQLYTAATRARKKFIVRLDDDQNITSKRGKVISIKPVFEKFTRDQRLLETAWAEDIKASEPEVEQPPTGEPQFVEPEEFGPDEVSGPETKPTEIVPVDEASKKAILDLLDEKTTLLTFFTSDLSRDLPFKRRALNPALRSRHNYRIVIAPIGSPEYRNVVRNNPTFEGSYAAFLEADVDALTENRVIIGVLSFSKNRNIDNILKKSTDLKSGKKIVIPVDESILNQAERLRPYLFKDYKENEPRENRLKKLGSFIDDSKGITFSKVMVVNSRNQASDGRRGIIRIDENGVEKVLENGQAFIAASFMYDTPEKIKDALENDINDNNIVKIPVDNTRYDKHELMAYLNSEGMISNGRLDIKGTNYGKYVALWGAMSGSDEDPKTDTILRAIHELLSRTDVKADKVYNKFLIDIAGKPPTEVPTDILSAEELDALQSGVRPAKKEGERTKARPTFWILKNYIEETNDARRALYARLLDDLLTTNPFRFGYRSGVELAYNTTSSQHFAEARDADNLYSKLLDVFGLKYLDMPEITLNNKAVEHAVSSAEPIVPDEEPGGEPTDQDANEETGGWGEKDSVKAGDIVEDEFSEEVIPHVIQSEKDGKRTFIHKINGVNERGVSVELGVVTENGAATFAVFLKNKSTTDETVDEVDPTKSGDADVVSEHVEETQLEEQIEEESTPQVIFEDYAYKDFQDLHNEFRNLETKSIVEFHKKFFEDFNTDEVFKKTIDRFRKNIYKEIFVTYRDEPFRRDINEAIKAYKNNLRDRRTEFKKGLSKAGGITQKNVDIYIDDVIYSQLDFLLSVYFPSITIDQKTGKYKFQVHPKDYKWTYNADDISLLREGMNEHVKALINTTPLMTINEKGELVTIKDQDDATIYLKDSDIEEVTELLTGINTRSELLNAMYDKKSYVIRSVYNRFFNPDRYVLDGTPQWSLARIDDESTRNMVDTMQKFFSSGSVYTLSKIDLENFKQVLGTTVFDKPTLVKQSMLEMMESDREGFRFQENEKVYIVNSVEFEKKTNYTPEETVRLFHTVGLSTFNEDNIEDISRHELDRLNIVGGDAKQKVSNRLFEEGIKIAQNKAKPNYVIRIDKDFEMIARSIMRLHGISHTLDYIDVKGDRQYRLRHKAPVFALNNYIERLTNSAYTTFTPSDVHGNVIDGNLWMNRYRMKNLISRDGYEWQRGSKPWTKLDEDEQMYTDIYWGFAHVLADNYKKTGGWNTVAIPMIVYSDSSTNLIVVAEAKGGYFRNPTEIAKELFNSRKRHIQSLSKNIISTWNSATGLKFNNLKQIDKYIRENGVPVEVIRHPNAIKNLYYKGSGLDASMLADYDLYTDIKNFDTFSNKLANNAKELYDYIKNNEYLSEKLLGDLKNVIKGKSPKEIIESYYYNWIAMSTEFDNLLMGPQYQYKGDEAQSYIDMVKRARLLNSTRTAMAFRDDNWAREVKRKTMTTELLHEGHKLSRYNKVAFVDDPVKIIAALSGELKSQEIYDGATFVNDLGNIFKRYSNGGDFGTNVHNVMKNITTVFRPDTGTAISVKNAEFTISSEILRKGSERARRIVKNMLSPKFSKEGLLFHETPVNSAYEVLQAMGVSPDFSNVTTNHFVELADWLVRNQEQDSVIQEVIPASSVKTGISGINDFDAEEYQTVTVDWTHKGTQLDAMHDVHGKDNRVKATTQIINALSINWMEPDAIMNTYSTLASITKDAQEMWKATAPERIKNLVRTSVESKEKVSYAHELVQGPFSIDSKQLYNMAIPVINSAISDDTIRIQLKGDHYVVHPSDGLIGINEGEGQRDLKWNDPVKIGDGAVIKNGVKLSELVQNAHFDTVEQLGGIRPNTIEEVNLYYEREHGGKLPLLFKTKMLAIRASLANEEWETGYAEILLPSEMSRDFMLDKNVDLSKIDKAYFYNKLKETDIDKATLEEKAGKMYNSFQDRLKGVLIRIPTTGKHSAVQIKVVGFVNNSGNSVFVPSTLLMIQGADQDIDKGTMITYDVVNNLVPRIDEVGDLVDKHLFKGVEGEALAAAKRNKIIDAILQIMSSSKNTYEANVSVESSLNQLRELADKTKIPDFSRDSYMSLVQMNVINQSGKALVGVFANAAKAYQMLYAYYKIKNMSDDEVLAGLDVDKEITSTVQAWSRFAALINAATDNAKELVLGRLGINIYNANLVSLLVAEGWKFSDIEQYINRPDIKSAFDMFKPLRRPGVSKIPIVEDRWKDKPELVAIYKRAEEFSMAARLVLNRELPSSAWDMFNFRRHIENHVTEVIMQPFSLEKFMKDEIYRANMIREYDNMKDYGYSKNVFTGKGKYRRLSYVPNAEYKSVKHNILEMVESVPHLFEYINTYIMANDILKQNSNVHNIISNVIDAMRNREDSDGLHKISKLAYKYINEYVYGNAVDGFFKFRSTKSYGHELYTPKGRKGFIDYMNKTGLKVLKDKYKKNKFIDMLFVVQNQEPIPDGYGKTTIIKTFDLMNVEEESLMEMRSAFKKLDGDDREALVNYSLIMKRGSMGRGSYAQLFETSDLSDFENFLTEYFEPSPDIIANNYLKYSKGEPSYWIPYEYNKGFVPPTKDAPSTLDVKVPFIMASLVKQVTGVDIVDKLPDETVDVAGREMKVIDFLESIQEEAGLQAGRDGVINYIKQYRTDFHKRESEVDKKDAECKTIDINRDRPPHK